MSDKQTCPYCQHENPYDAEKCEHCGSLIGSETTIWKARGELREIRRPAMRASEFVADVLYLYVAGAQNQKPIQHQGRGTVILGRSSEAAPLTKELIDLSEYHAFSLGVSRQHAMISYNDIGYTLEDLGSSNGTWLNGNRLLPRQAYPLRSGDHVQLGELLMFVYFV